MKKIFAFILAATVCLSLSGCMLPGLSSLLSLGLSSQKAEIINIETQIMRIGFANAGDDDYTDTLFVDTNELAVYESDLSQYSTSYFHEMLSDDEKLIYQAMEYALDNCYEQVIVDERLCSDANELIKILSFLSMDSPFVEQNLNYSLFTLSFTFPVENDNSTVQIPFSGYSIEIANFADDLHEKKLLSIDKAAEIIKTIPENLPIDEKALYLYLYITNNVEYVDYGDDRLHTYLYDALFLKETQCDGFSNALSLLYNLSGIPCIEKVSQPAEEGKAGHTWNCAYIDGNWYNFDSTIDPDDFRGVGCYFAFSDDLVDITPDYQDLMPVCNSGLYMNSSGHFHSESDIGVYETLYNGIKENGTYCLVTFDTFDYDKCSPLLKKLVNEACVSITTSYYEGTNKTVFLIECTD